MSDERGIALLNTTIDDGEGALLPNQFFEQMKTVLESMGVQVAAFTYKDLADPRARERILTQFAGMIVSGNGGFGPHFLKEPEFAKRYGFIVDFPKEKRLLGICRSLQSHAIFSGATLNPFLAPEHGSVETTIHDKDDHIFKDMSPKFEIYGAHSESVNPTTLPPKFKVIASSPKCCVSVLRIEGTKHWLSQNHPEFGNLRALQMLRNFLYAF